MKVNEIFSSIQGEGFWAGKPTVFVRLSGCNKECSFCDTKHSYYVEMDIPTIADKVNERLLNFPFQNITITGGEPFLHTDLINLLTVLRPLDSQVTVETNGSIAYKLPFAWITCSPKEILKDYSFANEIKFLIGGGMDYIFDDFLSKEKTFEGHVFLQPVWGVDEKINTARLQKCIKMASYYDARVSVQIHKLVGVR